MFIEHFLNCFIFLVSAVICLLSCICSHYINNRQIMGLFFLSRPAKRNLNVGVYLFFKTVVRIMN